MSHYSGQGPLYFGKYNTSDGLVGALRNVGDLESFELAFQTNEVTDTESQTGQRNVVARIKTSQEMNVRFNFKEPSELNFKLLLGGNLITLTGAAQSAYVAHAGALVAGDYLRTQHRKISSLVVTDSTGSPQTLTLNTHYKIIDADAGIIQYLTAISAEVQPLKFAYTFATQDFVTALSGSDDHWYAFFHGLNTATEDRLCMEVYKFRLNPAETIGMLNNEFGRFQVNGKAVKADEGAYATDTNSQYGDYARVWNPL